MAKRVRMAMIGCGGMGRNHLRNLLKQTDTTEIVALCDISSQSLAETAKVFEQAGIPMPVNEENLNVLLSTYHPDAVFIATPHNIHYDQARTCLRAGVDVLLEKPMVMNADEARSLIKTRDETGQLLVVAFNGSLSPEIRESVRLLRSGELGKLLSISGTVWQSWGPGTTGKWRQVPEISGGGFMFDTGAHLLNTVADLAGEEFVEVAAWVDNNSRPVETLAAVIARLASGALISLHGCGETIRTCKSDIRVFCTDAILRTGAWGRWLEVQRQGEEDFSPIELPPSLGVWEQFLSVRMGEIKNPSPPEVGLRMARLYDAIRASAGQDGIPVKCA
ncbi:MAG: Gfo/Idh/MocA family oxidoreductase [Anaerolineales bacterium]|nr:MAG: Gfo/Idh/MocA family oxidoreductase [Anaerolineales bacterium]